MSIKFLYIIFLFLSQISLSLNSSEDRKKFFEANYLFEQERYDQACKLYQSIEKKGFIVLYNMSLSYLNLGDNAKAMLYARRAEKLANFEQLTLLYEYFIAMKKNINPDYQVSFNEQVAIFIKKCILSIPMLLLQLILLIFYIACIVCWYNRRYRIYKNILVYILFFMIIFGFIWLFKNKYMYTSIGIVTTNDVFIFAGPDKSFYKKALLQKADEVIIQGSEKKYYKIQAKNNVGWVFDTSIEVV